MGQPPVSSLAFGINSHFLDFLFSFLFIVLNWKGSSVWAQNICHRTKRITTGEKSSHLPDYSPALLQETSTKVGRMRLPMSQGRCRDKWVRAHSLNYAHKTVRALLWSHCSSTVPTCGRTWATYVRLPELSPRSVNLWVTATVTHQMHFSSWTQIQDSGKSFWQPVRMGYSLLTFVIIKKKSPKYKLKRQKWLLCMRSDCLAKKSQWDFLSLFCT